MAELLGASGPLKGGRFGVLKPKCVLGRDVTKCDLVFPDTDLSISRVQAELSLGDGSWKVTCLADAGMSVQGKLVRKGEQYPLKNGDILTLGKSDFKFEAS